MQTAAQEHGKDTSPRDLPREEEDDDDVLLVNRYQCRDSLLRSIAGMYRVTDIIPDYQFSHNALFFFKLSELLRSEPVFRRRMKLLNDADASGFIYYTTFLLINVDMEIGSGDILAYVSLLASELNCCLLLVWTEQEAADAIRAFGTKTDALETSLRQIRKRINGTGRVISVQTQVSNRQNISQKNKKSVKPRTKSQERNKRTTKTVRDIKEVEVIDID